MSDLQSGHGVVKAKLGSSITNVVASALFLLPLTVHSFATPAGNFIDLSFEELANIQVTSVSKKAERLADAAASIFLITAEDIQQSGARSLPEVLRLAPNLQVAQTSASGYAISARGFNGSNSSAPNKLLVLIDGRSVYSPLFSGIFWDVQDVMLEDVERIEVISGPAGTLWGVNAVNGVINIITRSARDTQGNLAVIGAGNRENDLAWRFGGTLENGANYRVYGTYFDRHHLSKDDGTAVNDALHKGQIGFRADWQHAGTEWTVQGNAYDGAVEQPAPGSVATGTQFDLGTIPVSGVNLSGRWAQAMGDGSSISLQAYYDHTKRTVPPTFGEALNVVDLQFQHSLLPIDIHTLAWGANYRYGMSRVDNSVYFAFLPADVNQKWSSIFARDEVALSDTLRLVLGGRVERNVYTGNEFLPSARLAWKAAPDHLLWAAASRTVRAPSRLDRDAYVPGVPPFLLDGGRAVVSESARVYEAGYRGQFGDRMTYSVTAFHTAYDHLRTQEVAPSGTYLIFSNG
ncbi:MAG: TonB-dependent receptor, partial [Pseudomonadota bacterium]